MQALRTAPALQAETRRITMHDYMIAVICAVAVSGIIMLVVFHRLEVLSFRTVASITLASLITALIMPAIYSAISGGETDRADPTVIIMTTVAAFIAYVVIVLILSILISVIVPGVKPRDKDGKTSKTNKKDVKSDGSMREKTILEQVGALYFNDRAGESREEQEGAVSGSGTEPVAASIGSAEITAEAVHSETLPGMPEQPESGQDISYALDDQLYSAGMMPDHGTSNQLDTAAASGTETEQYAASVANAGSGMDTARVSEISSYTDGTQPEHEAAQTPENEDLPDAKLHKPLLAGDNYLEQIYLNYVAHDDELKEDAGEMTGEAASDAEKSVDSAEIIDKMGIENKVYDSEAMTIEECITEAFRLKEAGDLEGAILYFMYALDKKPQKELTFWIILDICVMYKTLGQQDLALEILNGYYEAYGDTMDVRLRDEIIRNLTDAGA